MVVAIVKSIFGLADANFLVGLTSFEDHSELFFGVI
jgi:hypothetical protein